MTINTENCRKLARAIEARAAVTELPAPTPMPEFYMSDWAVFWRMPRTHIPEEVVICNTAGCVAGSAVALLDPHIYKAMIVGSSGYTGSISSYARQLLGLTSEQACAVFTPGHMTSKIVAGHAAAMLDWLADNPVATHDEIIYQWHRLLDIEPPKWLKEEDE